MAADGFLSALRSKVAASAEFRSLSASLYAEVRTCLRTDGIPSFAELSDEEQRVLVQRARETVGKGDAFEAAKQAALLAEERLIHPEGRVQHRG